jgi:hypothetical protein
VRGDMTFAERVWENEGGQLRRPESSATPSAGPADVRERDHSVLSRDVASDRLDDLAASPGDGNGGAR